MSVSIRSVNSFMPKHKKTVFCVTQITKKNLKTASLGVKRSDTIEMENPSKITASVRTQSNNNATSDLLEPNGETESDWLESLAQTQIELLDSEVRPRSQGFLPAKPPG